MVRSVTVDSSEGQAVDSDRSVRRGCEYVLEKRSRWRGGALTRASHGQVRVSLHGVGCFFFSSRRRHTRCSRDWSSDVCSSDLSELPSEASAGFRTDRQGRQQMLPKEALMLTGDENILAVEFIVQYKIKNAKDRSEERRVGKECRSRWSPDH